VTNAIDQLGERSWCQGLAGAETAPSQHRVRRGDVFSTVEGVSADQSQVAAEAGFEEIYSRAGSNLGAIPWASLAANQSLVAWLDRQPASRGVACLVIGCGLGDDAEELARRSYRVIAFDVSPTAIGLCRKRFPASAVDYVVADLFAAPSVWSASFGLVVEIRTLQSLPPSRRREAARAIARTVESGGQVFVRCAAREADEPLTSRPWPLTRRELQAFTGSGLVETQICDEPAAPGQARMFTAIYQRPAASVVP
jgi:SAM-dependent methyltransferase